MMMTTMMILLLLDETPCPLMGRPNVEAADSVAAVGPVSSSRLDNFGTSSPV